MDLIMTLGLQGGMIRALVCVLVNIFDSLDRYIDFQIHVTVKLHQKLIWMGYHMIVIKDCLTLYNSAMIIRVSIQWMAIFLNIGLMTKRPCKMFSANISLYASLWSAGIMQHVFSNNTMQLRMKIWIRYLSRNRSINLLNNANLVLILQKN